MLPKGALVENLLVYHTGQYAVCDEGEMETRTSNQGQIALSKFPHLRSGIFKLETRLA